jgi:hypothetical protein
MAKLIRRGKECTTRCGKSRFWCIARGKIPVISGKEREGGNTVSIW